MDKVKSGWGWIVLVFSLVVLSVGTHWACVECRTLGIGGVVVAACLILPGMLRDWVEWYGRSGGASESQQSRDVRFTKDFVLLFVVIGTVFVVFFSLRHITTPPWSLFWGTLGAGCLLGFAALLCGAVIGFLFGIPRAGRDPRSAKKDATSPADSTNEAEENKGSAP